MFRVVLSLCAATGSLAADLSIGPAHPATSGEIWPKAFQETKQAVVYNVDPAKLQYKVTGKDCKLVQLAIQRCKDYVETLVNLSKRYGGHEGVPPQDSLNELQIDLSQDCEDYPQYGMDESYKLTVSKISVLSSSSVWGIIRGMETFSQLFYLTHDFKKILMKGTKIVDHPQYPYRSLLVDTSRHFITVPNILKTLDAMAMNKMNVFHWHIIDDQSFPYQSTKFPELSEKAAYHSSLVYKKSDMEMIRDYARDRGIRVVIEIDVPGHSVSWGASHPEIITDQCSLDFYSNPMNPIKNETYDLLREFFKEVQDLFPDSQIHLGGDEVYTDCWNQNPEIKKYMKQHNMKNEVDIWNLFYERVFPLLKKGTVPVVWEDPFTSHAKLPKNIFVEAWYDGDVIVNTLKAGHFSIQARGYYLDYVGTNFNEYYSIEPRLAIRDQLKNDSLLQNLVGGEACMWGEMMDDTNLLSRVWPRASAVAEVLWSRTHNRSPDEHTLRRIEEHACRMRRRGVPAEPPAGPGFCVL